MHILKVILDFFLLQCRAGRKGMSFFFLLLTHSVCFNHICLMNLFSKFSNQYTGFSHSVFMTTVMTINQQRMVSSFFPPFHSTFPSLLCIKEMNTYTFQI